MALRPTRAADEDAAPLRRREMVTGDGLVALAQRVQARCLEAGVTLATAESCTGGLIAHAVTEVAGSSGYFTGGFVTYADAAKIDLVAVPREVLAAHGAVSAQVARAMADGARARLGSDLAVAVTGIAGPGGGTDQKPVGLTYVAVSGRDGALVRRFVWHGDRTENKEASAMAALELVLELVPDRRRDGDDGPLESPVMDTHGA
jgi:PncC family amidohydrolase